MKDDCDYELVRSSKQVKYDKINGKKASKIKDPHNNASVDFKGWLHNLSFDFVWRQLSNVSTKFLRMLANVSRLN